MKKTNLEALFKTLNSVLFLIIKYQSEDIIKIICIMNKCFQIL